MADLVTRMRLDSAEYDQKVKRAAQNLLDFEAQCRATGQSMNTLSKENLEYVKALGNMQTVSKNARGQISELSSAFTELSMQYKRLSEEEKKGEVGKALTASIDQLKGRITALKTDLGDVNKELVDNATSSQGASSALDTLTSQFGISTKQLLSWGAAITAAKAALDVAKDAFFQSESNIDEWGRTVEGAKGAYEVFLNALNTDSWSNFFQNLQTAIQGGRDLYDTLDRLGSIKANNQAAIALVQAEIQQLRLLKQSGQDVDDKIKDATSRLAQLQGMSVNAGKDAGKTGIVNTLRNYVDVSGGKTGHGISDDKLGYVADKLLKEGQTFFDSAKRIVQGYENNPKYQGTTWQTSSTAFGGAQPVAEQGFDINKLTEQQKRQYLINKAITEKETKIQESISIYAQAVQEGASSAREQFKGNRYALQGSGGGGGDKTTPQERAAGMAAEAERTYAETLQKSAIRVEAGIDTELQAKKKELSAQERLFDAYNDAYAVYADPKYKEAATDAAEKMESLAGEVKGMEDAIADSKRTWVQGLSGFNSETMSAWMQGKQSDLNSAEFGSSEYNGISDQMTDMVNLKTVLETALKNGIDTAEFDLSGLYEKIFDAEQPGDIIPDEYWQAIIDQINEKIEEIGGEIKPLKLNVETGKIELAAKEGEKTAKAWSTAASMISTAGSALQSFENPAAKIAGVIAQAIATVALSYSQTLAKDSSSQSNIWSFIAAAAAATISMATTIAAIKSNTSGYAQGGIVDGSGGGFVGGTAYSGDNVGNVRLDSGELVLNRAQQSNLADQLTGGFGDEAAPEVRISGEDLILVMNTSLRRQGFGRLAIGDFS